MAYFKNIKDGYILSIGNGISGDIEITEQEYNNILTAIQTAPTETETVAYRLKTDLLWESYEKDLDPEPDESDYATAGRILMGVEE